MKLIGLYGGTFDPIHNGHINLAIELMEKRKLDEVWFIPAKVNPHKSDISFTSYEDRLAMIRLATQEISGFKVDEIEYSLPTPSYTIHTIQALQERESHASIQFFLMLGEDSIKNFLAWHQPEEIVKRVPLLIGSRSCDLPFNPALKENPLIYQAIREGWTKTHVLDISATYIRQRLSNGEYCGHLTHSSVIEYSKAKNLYR